MDFTPEHNEYRIKDRIGTWSIIDSYFDKDNKRWFLLMESCQYGDEAGCVVVYFYAEKAEGVITRRLEVDWCLCLNSSMNSVRLGMISKQHQRMKESFNIKHSI